MVFYSLAGNSGEQRQKVKRGPSSCTTEPRPSKTMQSLVQVYSIYFLQVYPQVCEKHIHIIQTADVSSFQIVSANPHTCKSGCSILAERAKPHRPDQSWCYSSCLWYLESFSFILEPHPGKLTCPLKRDYFNRKCIFQPLIFRGHDIVFHGVSIQ